MKLRELFEEISRPATVGICYGRWNPPHKGHRAVWEIAAQFDEWYIGTNKNTTGPADPLPYDVKIKAMEAIWPAVAGHIIPEQNLFELAAKLYASHGENVDLKVATDETWLINGLLKYNGVQAPHGYYKFNSISHVPTPRLSSATALRAAVRQGNRVAFTQAAGVEADTPIRLDGKSVPFFDLVSHYLLQNPEKVKKEKKTKELTEFAVQGLRVDIANYLRRPISAINEGLVNPQTVCDYIEKFATVLALKHTVDFTDIQQVMNQYVESKLAVDTAMFESHNPGKLKKSAENQGGSNWKMRDIGGYDRIYHMHRIMMATAMADGKSKKAVDMDSSSWIEKYNSAHPFTNEEDLMMQQAFATVPSDAKHIVTDRRSLEQPSTNKVSPVAAQKRNKYGV